MASEENKPLLICFPGISCHFSQDMKKILHAMNDHFKVKLVETGASSDHAAWRNSTKLWRFNKAPEKHLYIQNGPGNVPNPPEFIKQCLDEEGDGAGYFLLGNSFGCKVIACLLKSENDFFGPAGKIGNTPLGVIFCGFPLYKSPSDDKAALIGLGLPESTHALFISGEKDEYLNEGSATGAEETRVTSNKRGETLLRSYISILPCSSRTKLVMTAGRHGIMDGIKKSEYTNSVAVISGEIVRFAEKCAGVGKSDPTSHKTAKRSASKKRVNNDRSAPSSKKAKAVSA